MAVLSAIAIAMFVAGEPIPADPRVSLRWQAPPECPSEHNVRERAETLLLASDARVDSSGEVTAVMQRFALALTVTSPGGTARFEHVADDCAVLAEIAALFIAVAADPIAMHEPRTVAPPPTPAPPSAATPSPEPADAAPPRDPHRTREIGGFVRAHGIIGAAELPQLDAGIGIAGALAIDRFRLEAAVSYLVEQDTALPGLAPATARLSAWNIQLRGCFELGRHHWRIAGCLGPELGAMVGRADHVRKPGNHVALWAAATVGPVLRWIPTPRVQIHAGIDGVLALTRPSFALVDDIEATVVARPGGVRAMLGLAIGLGVRKTGRARDRSASRRRSP